jgi:RNA polymerase sigma factor (sigma-70 family)
MNAADQVDALRHGLAGGDSQAINRLVIAYEPYLRAVVRRALPDRFRAKFDSVDVVQSVWVHVLHGLRKANWQFEDDRYLHALLVQVTRRRLVSRYRHFQKSVEHEEPVAGSLEDYPSPQQTRPSEVARRDEMWQHMLALCPAAHHEVLRLRRQGHALAEIADRTGLHEGSVRRILRRLARRLALPGS